MSERSEDLFRMSNGTSVDGESTVRGTRVQQTNQQQTNESNNINNNIKQQCLVIESNQSIDVHDAHVICITDSEADNDDDDDDDVKSVVRAIDEAEISLLSSSDDISDLSSTDETALYYSAFARSTLQKSTRGRPASLNERSINTRLNQAKKRTRIQRKADRAALRASIAKDTNKNKNKKIKSHHHVDHVLPKQSRHHIKPSLDPNVLSADSQSFDGSIVLQCVNRTDTVTVHRNHSLTDVNHVVLVDLDNWRHFWVRIPSALPNDVFISGFASVDTMRSLKVPDDAIVLENAGADGIPDEELVTLSPFTRLLAAHRIQLHVSGCSANAADFAMSFVGGMLHASLPLHVSFTILSGDKGLEESVRLIKLQGRECRRVDPHALTIQGDSITTDNLIFHTLSSLIRPR